MIQPFRHIVKRACDKKPAFCSIEAKHRKNPTKVGGQCLSYQHNNDVKMLSDGDAQPQTTTLSPSKRPFSPHP